MKAKEIVGLYDKCGVVPIVKSSDEVIDSDIIRVIQDKAVLILTDKEKVITESIDCTVAVNFRDITNDWWDIDSDIVLILPEDRYDKNMLIQNALHIKNYINKHA